MTIRMLINATVADELRVAVVEDGELVDLDIEAAERSSMKGSIYKGVVHNVEASLDAAFVNFGHHKQGFLPFDEIAPSQYSRPWEKSEPPRINDVIRRGQEIVVQVSKDALQEKGAALTTYLSLPGRYSVLMPGSDARGISRKIEDETERSKIRHIAEKIQVPDDSGFIIRTAGLGQPKAAIQADVDRLVALKAKIERTAQIARAPSLLHAEADLISRTLRDLVTDRIEEIWIDNREEYEAARTYFEELMPEFLEKLHYYQNPIPIFSYYRVEEQIEETFSRRVALPSGGSIAIDETEALVAIDVNSGKMTKERDHEDTVYMTNFEAAQVVARQLRLRDLGGIVVVDFIDMELSRNNRAVEKALKDAIKSDRARIKVSRILANGLCILTRQRIRTGMKRAYQRRCQVCHGTGWLRTPESHSLSVLKRVETRLAQGGVEEVRVLTHKETAEYLVNQKRAELLALEREYQCRVIISARAEMERDADDVQFLSKGDLLTEMTDRLPAREEPKRRGEPRRKSSKRKEKGRGQPEADRAAAVVEAPDAVVTPSAADGSAEAESSDTNAQATTSSRRRRKRRRGDERSGNGEAVQRERTKPREPSKVDGVTFTGRPPPEVLEKIRAEARARREARESRVVARVVGESSASPQETIQPMPVHMDGSSIPNAPQDLSLVEPKSGSDPERDESTPSGTTSRGGILGRILRLRRTSTAERAETQLGPSSSEDDA